MHATLALAAGFWAANMPMPDYALQRERYRQKGHAMKGISTYLSTRYASAQVPNQILSATGSLANAEVNHLSRVVRLAEGTETDTGNNCRLLKAISMLPRCICVGYRALLKPKVALKP